MEGHRRNLGAEYIGLRYGQSAVQLYTWLGIAARMVGAAVALYSIAVIVCALIPIPEATGTGAKAWLMGVLRGGDGMLSVPLMIIAVGVIVVIISGNLWAVLITDTLQFIVLTIAVLIVLPLLFAHPDVGGISGFLSSAAELPAAYPDGDVMAADEGKSMLSLASGDFTWLFLGGFVVIHMFKIGGEWAFVQRFLSVPSRREATLVATVFGVLYLVSPLIWMLPPMMYRLIDPLEVGMSAAEANGVAENAYILACQLALPAGMVGLMIAAMFSATVSMVDSEINVYAGALTRDVYAKRFNKEGDEKHLVRVGKLLTIVLGGAVVGIALLINANGRGGAESLILSITGLFVGPIVLPTIWALFSKRVGASAVFITVIVGGLFSAMLKFGPGLVGDGNAISQWIAANSREAEVLVGIVPPLVTLIVLELLARGESPRWPQVAALAKTYHAGPPIKSSSAPALIVGVSLLALAVLFVVIAVLQDQERVLMLGVALLLAELAMLCLVTPQRSAA